MTEYFAPTHAFFGKGAEEKAAPAIKAKGFRKVLIHYGRGSAVSSGLIGRIERELEAEGIECVLLGGVVPNPRISLAREGIRLAEREGVDFLLAVGGGSVIDSAKAIACGLANREGDVWDYYMGKRTVAASFPIGVVLTLSATGSEMSNSTVMSNEEGIGYKRGINSDYLRPLFAFMNPELTYTVSPYQTASGSTDIAMHTLERFFHKDGACLDITDSLSFALVKNVMNYAPLAVANGFDYEARANLMWDGAISHNGLMNMGNDDRGDWACHQLEHELGAEFDVAHGAGLAAVWPSWARYVSSSKPERFAALGRGLFDLRGSDEEAAGKTIDRLEEFFVSIGMPHSLEGLGIKVGRKELENMAYNITFQRERTIGSYAVLGEEEIVRILEDASRD